MSNSKSDKDSKSGFRALFPVLLILIVTMSSTAGCIDKGIVDSLVDIVDGDDGPELVWEPILTKEGNFRLDVEDDFDIERIPVIAIKIVENLSDPDPTQTPLNLKKVMNEENISMETITESFYVVEGTKNLNVELTGIFVTSGGDNAPSGGYMEITIEDPNGGRYVEELTQFEEENNYIFPQEPIPGKWTVELQGLGLQSPGDLIYSGRYILNVRAQMPKE